MKTYAVWTVTPSVVRDRIDTDGCVLLVAATSWAAAGRALRAHLANLTDSFLRQYGYITGNAADIEAATTAAHKRPGTVLAYADRGGPKTYVRLP